MHESSPYLTNVARPFWISSPTARQGDLLAVYGFGLRPPHSECRVALWNGRDGATLRRAAPEASVLEGFGYDPQGPRRAWHSPHQAAASPVLVFHDHTCIEKLTVRGAPRDGPAGVALIQSAATGTRSVKDVPMRDITVRGCRLFAQEDMLTGRAPYGRCHVFHTGPRSEYVRFASNEVYGSVEFSYVTRLDLIDNRFHSGGGHGYCYDSLIDANYFVDSPTRFLFYPRRHKHIRFNEAHQAFRSSWYNAIMNCRMDGAREMGERNGASHWSGGISFSVEKPAASAVSLTSISDTYFSNGP
jgi:hypothetical protein